MAMNPAPPRASNLASSSIPAFSAELGITRRAYYVVEAVAALLASGRQCSQAAEQLKKAAQDTDAAVLHQLLLMCLLNRIYTGTLEPLVAVKLIDELSEEAPSVKQIAADMVVDSGKLELDASAEDTNGTFTLCIFYLRLCMVAEVNATQAATALDTILTSQSAKVYQKLHTAFMVLEQGDLTINPAIQEALVDGRGRAVMYEGIALLLMSLLLVLGAFVAHVQRHHTHAHYYLCIAYNLETICFFILAL
eukprot:m.131817 g.131817  ORF g.131817 m.131817 type:complete len:250 (+) comp13926_c0_seq4:110-859(+)